MTRRDCVTIATGTSAGLLIASTPLLASTNSSTVAATPDPTQIAAGLGDDPSTFDQRLDAAYLRHDVAFIEDVVADDMRFTHGTATGEAGPVWDKQQFLDAVRSYKGSERNVDSVQVERHQDVVETVGRVQVKTPSAQRPEYQIYFVRLYAHRASRWQFLSHRTVRLVIGPLPKT